MARLLLLALCAAPGAYATVRAPIAQPVTTGLAGLFRALPPQFHAPIGQFLDAGSLNLPALQQSLRGLTWDPGQPLSGPALPAGLAQAPALAPPSAQAARAAADPAQDRELVAALAGGFLQRAERPSGPADLLDAAAKLSALERLLAAQIPLRERVMLLDAVRTVRRELSGPERAVLLARMAAVARQLESFSAPGSAPAREAPGVLAAAPAPGRAGAALPAAWRLQAPAAPETLGSLTPLNALGRRELARVKEEVLEAAQEMYEEAQIEGRGGIFPIPEDLFDQIAQLDERTGFSQIYRDSEGRVIGFALAYFDSQNGTVHLEKLGVLREHRKAGLSKLMLQALAQKADSFGVPLVDLLVVKTNSEAIPAYERLGFDNVTPAPIANDDAYNAYHFVAPTRRLLARTAPAQEGAQPRAPPAAQARVGRFSPRRLLSALSRLLGRSQAPAQASAGPNLEALFLAANPGSAAPEVLREYGHEFGYAAADLLIDQVFASASIGFDPVGNAPWFAGPAFKGALQEIMDVSARAERGEPAALAFVRAAGRYLAGIYAEEMLSEDMRPYRWPQAPIPGEFWDLASGPNGGRWVLAGLDPKAEYRLFDSSEFSVAYIEEMVRIARARAGLTAKVSVEKRDVRRLDPPKKPLAVIRAKNVHAYVPGSEADLERMTAWIAEGGQLILQNNPAIGHRMAEIQALGPMIERLIAAGWRFDYSEGQGTRGSGALEVYTITLTKPRAGMDRRELRGQAELSGQAWQGYRTRVERAANPFEIIRQLFGGSF